MRNHCHRSPSPPGNVVQSLSQVRFFATPRTAARQASLSSTSWIISVYINNGLPGTSLVVQWLRLHASHAGDMSLIPGWETKISHATGHQKKDKRWPFSRNQVPGESKTIHVTRKQQLHYTSSYNPLGASLVAQMVKSLHVGDLGSIPGLEDPWRRDDTPLQYSCLENALDRGALWATVHRVPKSQA